eukprot:g511.t1
MGWLAVCVFRRLRFLILKMKRVLVLILLSLFALHNVDAAEFVWGTASSAFQYEGAVRADGRGPSIWDAFCEERKCGNTRVAEPAVGQYDLDILAADIEKMVDIGTTAYRMSLSWSRIMPTGRPPVEMRGVRHYMKVLNMLKRANIEPHVTLFHFDLPLKLEHEGGWLNQTNIVSAFTEYATFCFETYGHLVRRWYTINEAHTIATAGYLYDGVAAPGRCSNRQYCREGNGTTEPYLVAHNLLLSHASAVEVFRERYSRNGSTISMVISGDWTEPDTNDDRDVEAAMSRQLFQIGWFADPIFKTGRYPKIMRRRVGSRLPRFTAEQSASLLGSSDYFAINHYTSRYARALPPDAACPPVISNGWDDDQCCIDSPFSSKGTPIGPRTGSADWLYTVPWGFRKLLRWLHKRYAQPIFVTENGCTDPATNAPLNDSYRIDYHSSYVQAMQTAMQKDGVDVRGYFLWSLLDNFEWGDGTRTRFGIFRVDDDGPNATLKRTPKASAKWFRGCVRSGACLTTSAQRETGE